MLALWLHLAVSGKLSSLSHCLKPHFDAIPSTFRSIILIEAANYFNANATTASFSSGFILQVEYTRRPPILSMLKPRTRQPIWIGCNYTAPLKAHERHRSGDFLSVPSPEQGTSARILSNLVGKFGIFVASKHVRTNYGVGCSIRLCIKVCTRVRLASLATNKPVTPTFSTICYVFEPGAAHISRILSPGYASSSNGGSIDTSS